MKKDEILKVGKGLVLDTDTINTIVNGKQTTMRMPVNPQPVDGNLG